MLYLLFHVRIVPTQRNQLLLLSGERPLNAHGFQRTNGNLLGKHRDIRLRLVPVPLDRNNKALWLECPARYAQRIQDLFLADPLHYQHLPLTPEAVLGAMRRDYAAAHLDIVAP